MIREAGFAVAVVLAGSLSYDPYMLQLELADGTQAAFAATSPATCQAAIRALWSGLWQVSAPVVRAHCEPGNLFAPGSDKIEGYNR